MVLLSETLSVILGIFTDRLGQFGIRPTETNGNFAFQKVPMERIKPVLTEDVGQHA